ncbi:MAG: hypothetical protein ACRDK2_01285 [Solirubrobacteraceae bacterium]
MVTSAIQEPRLEAVAPRETDLQELGSQLDEALYRLNELGLGDIVIEASKALRELHADL